MKQAAGIQLRPFLWAGAVALGACYPLSGLHAQESDEQQTVEAESIEEIVIVVDRSGRSIDVDALRLEQIRRDIIEQFGLEQTKQEEELWRLRLRSTIQRSMSRISWGYDARRDAAAPRYLQASSLPMDGVRPATVISISF